MVFGGKVWVVVVGARREQQVAELVDEFGDDRAIFAQLDVTNEQDWASAVQTAARGNYKITLTGESPLIPTCIIW